ncbi:MAG: signal peptidase I [Clostridiales bacterium]|nr:signal peptidase I [Clostridiales bacterium]
MENNVENLNEIKDEKKDKEKLVYNIYDFCESAITAIIFIMLLFVFVCRFLNVDGNSMVPTLSNGDKVVAMSAKYTPAYGDIVIVAQPNVFDEPIIKRVIATSGQTVNISNGYVYVDGKKLEEPYVAELTAKLGDQEYPLEVPDGYVFVMGDNRNRSTDSRFKIIGLIDERYILGKVKLRILPFGNWNVYKNFNA